MTWWSRRSWSARSPARRPTSRSTWTAPPATTYDKTGVVLNQANNWTVTYTGIPTGVSCVVTEPVVPAGWTLTSISPTPAVIGGTPVTVTVTNTRNGIPGLDKTSAPADGVAQVAPGDLINYSVTVSNTGGLPITGPVVDTLPAGLTVVPTTITGGGTPNATNTVITWQVVNLAPGATLTFTYQAVVGSGVTTGQNLVNVVTFQGLQDSTTTPVELPPVLPIEDEEVVAAEEEIAATGAEQRRQHGGRSTAGHARRWLHGHLRTAAPQPGMTQGRRGPEPQRLT